MPTSIQLQIGTKQQSPEANVHTVCSFTSHAPTLQNATLTKFVQPPLGTDYPSQQIHFACIHLQQGYSGHKIMLRIRHKLQFLHCKLVIALRYHHTCVPVLQLCIKSVAVFGKANMCN